MTGGRAVFAFVLAASFFTYAFVQRVAPSVIVGELMSEFAVGAAVLGNLAAFYFYGYAPLQIPVGMLMDRFGPRRLMSFAAGVSAIGAVIFAIAPSIEVAYLGRFLVGMGAAFGWVGVLTVATLWFPPTRFAMLTGVAQLFGMIGAIFGQAPLGLAVEAWGWRGTLGALAVFGVLLAIAIYTVVADKRAVAAQAASSFTAGMRAVLKSRDAWLASLYGFAMTGTMLAFAGLWAVPWLMQTHGLARGEAALLSSLMFAGWGIGSPVIGYAVDRLGRRVRAMTLLSAGMALTLAAILYAPGLGLPGLAVLMFVNGACASSMVVAYAHARDHSPANASGAAYGLVNTAVVGSGAVMQPLIGALLDRAWDGTLAGGTRLYGPEAYAQGFSVLLAVAVLGSAATWLMRETAPAKTL
jgi:MFS family permease